MKWFKRKKKPPEPICFHLYRMIDFGYWGSSIVDYGGKYELACVHCGKKRTVDENTFESLKMRGLAKEATE